MLEVLAQLMKDMLHPQPTAVRQAQGGTQKGRIHGHVKPSASSIMQFPCSVVIVSQLADQQPADFFKSLSDGSFALHHRVQAPWTRPDENEIDKDEAKERREFAVVQDRIESFRCTHHEK